MALIPVERWHMIWNVQDKELPAGYATIPLNTYEDEEYLDECLAEIGMRSPTAEVLTDEEILKRSIRLKHYERIYKRKEQLMDLLGGKCARCGCIRHPELMHFHHYKFKSFVIATAIQDFEDGDFQKRLIPEVKDKCQLLCRKCHGEVHKIWGLSSPMKGEDDIRRKKSSLVEHKFD